MNLTTNLKWLFLIFCITGFFSWQGFYVRAEEHGHKHEDERQHAQGQHHEHHDEDDHDDEEGNTNVGPDKGIISVSSEKGFSLSPEATKTFGIKSEKPGSFTTFTVPKSSLIYSGETVGVFRARDHFFKRITVSAIKQSDGQVQVRVTDLQPGDEVVTQGAPFLRITELDAAGGIGHGHSH